MCVWKRLAEDINTLAFVEPLINQRSSSTTPRQNTFYNQLKKSCQIFSQNLQLDILIRKKH